MQATFFPGDNRIDEYEGLVDEKFYQILYGDDPQPGNRDHIQTDAVADEDYCNGPGREEMKEKMKAACRPEVIYDSLVVHEDMHCRQIGHFGSGDNAAVFGLQEVNAYLAGADVLMNWLEEHCPQYDLVKEKQRVARIRQPKSAH